MTKTSSSWTIHRWHNRPNQLGDPLPWTCPECFIASGMPCARLDGATISAVLPGNKMVLTPWSFNPPRNFLPDRVECPHCGLAFILEEPTKEES